VERSGPDDAWDEPWDGNDDDVAPAYPPAPLPAHERAWRHPSEVGQATWQHTEPPIAIGRGLLVTTGAIGCVLGIAVLLLLVPIGGGLAPTASPTATSSFAIAGTAPTGTAPAGTAPTELLGSTGPSTSAAPAQLPAEQVPSTVLVSADPATTAVRPQGASMAIAVSVANQRFMITTAHAVLSSSGVSIIGPGDSASGTVVSIGADLAFIEPGRAIEVASFAAVATAEPGQEVTVLADEPTDVAYAPDGGIPELDAATVREGTPVVDADGALVALCTLIVDGDGTYVDLVPIIIPDDLATPDTTLATTDDSDSGSDPPTPTTPPPSTTTTAIPSTVAAPVAAIVTTQTPLPWAGLRFDGAPAAAPLTVTGVAPASPASVAGIGPGDRITAIDGTLVGTVDELLVGIRRHVPGDMVSITLVPRSANTATAGPAAAERTVIVTLGAFVPTG
jgi:membrane-associated protease RseP (regulator of RpoE activity)